MIKPGLRGRKGAYYIRIVGRLNLIRIMNLLVLFFSYLITRYSARYFFAGQPSSMSIEPTNHCQLQCPDCPCGSGQLERSGGRISRQSFERVLDSLSRRLILVNLFFQGEPFLHPELTDLIRYARHKRIYTVVSTNGNLMSRRKADELVASGLDHLIVSIDGTTEEVYRKYRVGGALEKVKEGISWFLMARQQYQTKGKKRGPLLELQFVVTGQNEHQIHEFLQWARVSGADLYRLKSAQIYEPDKNCAQIPTIPSFSRYEPDGEGTYRIKSRLANHCWRMWSTPVLTWDGQILPCCFDKKAEYSYGNLVDDHVMDLWKNMLAASFRQRVFSNRRSVAICCNCTEGLRT